ncbi:MAG: AtpZ/AtpI family protein [Acidobacteriia bacterium]|nr:AtpZ/AtpI family protein [Terriglobia bacterium]
MPDTPEQRMIRDVAAKQQRMLRARREKKGNWSALSILGVVGWSVVVPTLAGIALGAWIDLRFPSRFSWTVILLIVGLALGCATAWRRIGEDR